MISTRMCIDATRRFNISSNHWKNPGFGEIAFALKVGERHETVHFLLDHLRSASRRVALRRGVRNRFLPMGMATLGSDAPRVQPPNRGTYKKRRKDRVRQTSADLVIRDSRAWPEELLRCKAVEVSPDSGSRP